MKKAKTVLRWMGVLPAALVLPCLCGIALYLVLFPLSFLDFLGEWVPVMRWVILTAAISFFWPVWAIIFGVLIAPAHKVPTTFVLGILVAVLIALCSYTEQLLDTPPALRTRPWQLVLGIVGVFYGVGMMWRQYHKQPGVDCAVAPAGTPRGTVTEVPNRTSGQTSPSRQMTCDRAKVITAEFGEHIELQAPLIKDAALLPYSKGEIMEAMQVCESELAGRLTPRSSAKGDRPAIESCLESLRSCRVLLCEYADIDYGDRDAVAYFNSFASHREIPDDRKDDFLTLSCKYTVRGMESELPGFSAMVDSRPRQ